MNLWLRLLILWFRLPYMPKMSNPLDKSTLTLRVMPTDLDVFMHMNNGRYLTIMDLGRLHLMGVTGLLSATRKMKWFPLLGSAKVHFIRPLTLFQRFDMTTQVIYWDEKWIYVEQKIHHQGKLCAVAIFKILFASKERKIPPKELMQFLPGVPESLPIPHSVHHWKEAEKHSRR